MKPQRWLLILESRLRGKILVIIKSNQNDRSMLTKDKLVPTILMIEDERATRDSIKRVLRSENLQFLEAGDGYQAFEILDQHHIDLILLDLNMPRMNGFEFLRFFRSTPRFPITPICVMTGESGSKERQQVIDLGADDFICKPAEFIELKTRIRSLLRIGRYQAELSDVNNLLEQRVAERTNELFGMVEELKAAKQETDLAYREMVLRLSLAAEMKDKCTAEHLERMSQYSTLLALRCGWDAERADLLVDAAKMHDIGKLGIPDNILNKPGKLTKEEFGVMQSHTEIGARILAGSKSRLLQMAAEIALTHHERFDGTGYPHGLIGVAIPEVGRIVAIADVFDALLSRRSYKQAWSLEATIDALQSGAGKHFDPRLVDLFLREIEAVCNIHDQYLDNSGGRTHRFHPDPPS